MSERIRTPALAPPPIRPAVPCANDPTSFLETHYRHVWQTRMHDMPFINAALGVEAIGFCLHEGDWLGVVVTPWFLNLLLVSGGGQLWGDIPSGERRYLNLPCGTLQFIADDDPDIGPYQYCPLIAPVSNLADMAQARLVAVDALKTVLGQSAAAPPEVQPLAEEKAAVSRRGFFRRLAGKPN